MSNKLIRILWKSFYYTDNIYIFFFRYIDDFVVCTTIYVLILNDEMWRFMYVNTMLFGPFISQDIFTRRFDTSSNVFKWTNERWFCLWIGLRALFKCQFTTTLGSHCLDQCTIYKGGEREGERQRTKFALWAANYVTECKVDGKCMEMGLSGSTRCSVSAVWVSLSKKKWKPRFKHSNGHTDFSSFYSFYSFLQTRLIVEFMTLALTFPLFRRCVRVYLGLVCFYLSLDLQTERALNKRWPEFFLLLFHLRFVWLFFSLYLSRLDVFLDTLVIRVIFFLLSICFICS